MVRSSRSFQLSVLVLATAIAWSQPQTASAWFGRCHRGFHGYGFRPWCGPVVGPGCHVGWGWGGLGWGGWYGGPRFACYDAVSFSGPFGSFFSGSVSSYVIGPRWCGPTFSYGFPCTLYPYPVGYGCWGYTPIIVSPYRGSLAPVYGPAGILPYMGLSATASTAPVQSLAAGRSTMPPMVRLAQRAAAGGPAAMPPVPQLALGQTTPPAATAIAVRASNGAARLRAARLVAIGDRHLRASVHSPAKLAAALDAYRRAATIAPDLPDTFLRQAIVLTALERDDDAAKAVDRAVVLDARLDIGRNAVAGKAVRAAVVVSEPAEFPPDPVFGDRPDPGPTTFVSRTTSLLDRIFPAEPAGMNAAAPAGAGPVDMNWIAARWVRQWQGQLNAVATR